jgi:hypothetical protein
MKNQIAQKKKKDVKTMTPGQMKDFISAWVQEVPVTLPYNSKGRILKEVRKLFVSVAVNPYADAVLGWEQFYLKHFQRTYDFSQLLIPDCPGENWRLLIIVDLLLEQLYAKMKELFPSWRWTDKNLDELVNWNERNAKKGAYAIWVKDVIEADEEYKNHSANKIKEIWIATETLGERMIHELKFFDETGKHLDIENVTLCSGSRYSDGNVPLVSFHPSDGGVSVYWDVSGNALPGLRSRQVVSSPTKSEK